MAENNREKTKKQHYVPRCYLEQWAIPSTYQIHVYDTKTNKFRRNNIRDVASENYFHDIDFNDILTQEDIESLGLTRYDIENLNDEQFLENYLSRHVEDRFGPLLKHIINRVMAMSPWELRNCYFLSKEQKYHFSFHLAWQLIRVKSIRESIADSSDCLVQLLEDMGASLATIEQYSVSKSDLACIHTKMILDEKECTDLAKSFFSLTWVLLLNRTSLPFYTSDNPIGTKAHIKHPMLSMNGLDCRGVEAYFPLSPSLLLLMFDGNYHTHFKGDERRIVEVDIDKVKHYNSLTALNCSRCVFSSDDDFSVVLEVLKKNPNAFNRPRSLLKGGSKTYTPRNNQ